MSAKVEIEIISDDFRFDLHLDGRQYDVDVNVLIGRPPGSLRGWSSEVGSGGVGARSKAMSAKVEIEIISDDFRFDLHLDGRQREMLEVVRRLADALIEDTEEVKDEPSHE